MIKEEDLKETYMPKELDFTGVFTPKKRTTPMRKQDHAAQVNPGDTKSDFIPMDKMLGGKASKDPLDGSARPVTNVPQVVPDIDFEKMTGSGK